MIVENGAKRLARESQRFVAIEPIEKLNISEIRHLSKKRFQCELEVIPAHSKALKNVEALHRRLDDAILILADRQGGGKNGYMALENVLRDICIAFDWHIRA